jgi:TrpR-related protein YerC/YecD
MKKTKFLYQSFLQLKTEDEVKRYLRDLLTEQEISEFADRLNVAKLLSQKTTYAIISKQTSMSSTTIARINKWLKRGCNGYKLVLTRLHHNQLLPPQL